MIALITTIETDTDTGGTWVRVVADLAGRVDGQYGYDRSMSEPDNHITAAHRHLAGSPWVVTGSARSPRGDWVHLASEEGGAFIDRVGSALALP